MMIDQYQYHIKVLYMNAKNSKCIYLNWEGVSATDCRSQWDSVKQMANQEAAQI